VLIGRDSQGLYALDSLCTHQQCDLAGGAGTLSSTGDRIGCRCHSSLFDAEGRVLAGPATRPLGAWALALGSDGQLYVDRTTAVPGSTRLPG
jgi:Rieske Fe-S protein